MLLADASLHKASLSGAFGLAEASLRGALLSGTLLLADSFLRCVSLSGTSLLIGGSSIFECIGRLNARIALTSQRERESFRLPLSKFLRIYIFAHDVTACS
jgi:hypothetical protein